MGTYLQVGRVVVTTECAERLVGTTLSFKGCREVPKVRLRLGFFHRNKWVVYDSM